jgi:hypothetical protein
MERLLARHVSMDEVTDAVIAAFREIFEPAPAPVRGT